MIGKLGWSAWVVFFLFVVSACSDDVDSPRWQFDDGEQIRGVEGPQTDFYSYLGAIGEEHYFHLGHRADLSPIIETYRPGRGWRIEENLTDTLRSDGMLLFSVFDRIIAHDGAYFFLHPRDSELLRSDDDGESWRVVGAPLDELLHGGNLSSDGEYLFVRGQDRYSGSDALLFFNDDGGESWEEIVIADNPEALLRLVRSGLVISRFSYSLLTANSGW